jgi:hypothetical protein
MLLKLTSLTLSGGRPKQLVLACCNTDAQSLTKRLMAMVRKALGAFGPAATGERSTGVSDAVLEAAIAQCEIWVQDWVQLKKKNVPAPQPDLGLETPSSRRAWTCLAIR